MSGRLARRVAVAAVAVVLAGAAWAVFGSAATLTVTPKNASAFRTCVLTGYPASTTALTDTAADQGSPNTNRGAASVVEIASRTGSNARAYLRFDLSRCSPAVASSAVVKQASLRLRLAVAPASTRTYEVHRVTTPCPETGPPATCWTETGLTWNAQPGMVATVTSSLTLASDAPTRYKSWDVTADAAAMVAGTVPNYGWAIKDAQEDFTGTRVYARFASKNAGVAAGAPELVIVYSP